VTNAPPLPPASKPPERALPAPEPVLESEPEPPPPERVWAPVPRARPPPEPARRVPLPGRRLRRRARPVTRFQNRDHGVDLHRLTGRDLNLFQHPRRRRRNLRVHLVGRYLKQRLIAAHRLTRFAQPLGHGAFKNRFPHLGHDDVNGH